VVNIIASSLILIFLILSAIHIYWAFGGKWASEAVVPTVESNETLFKPGVFATLIVAFGLLGFGAIVFLNIAKFDTIEIVSIFSKKYGLWIIAFIFLVRAIGDFKYVGFFKKLTNTKFGQLDTKLYSPLCLLITILTLLLQVLK
jgi:Protein of unknown function (DUF3995)